MEILGFFGGVLYFYTHASLVLVCLLIFFGFRPSWKLLIACCLGYALGLAHQWGGREQGMPEQAVIQKATLVGVIASIPKCNLDRTQFEFELQSLNTQPVSAHIQLSCYRDCPEMHAGQVWTFRAKLHKAHNLNNPGGFDYTTYLGAKHIHWVGYVLPGGMRGSVLHPSPWNMVVIREKMAAHLSRLLPDVTTLGIVQALTLGVTTQISKESWALFRCTGTTHLMVISGAHIGLVAGMVFKFLCWFWSRFKRLCLHYPAQRAASLAAIISGLCYAVVAGFGAPAERATVASVFIFLRYIGQRQYGAWQAWRYAFFAVLVTEPHSVLLPGFYLSFFAVAILLTMNQRILSQKIRKAMWIQLSCMVGLLPFTVYWFSYGAVNGLFANIVAIPWVSFVIVPLSFLCLGVGHYVTWLPTGLHLCIYYFLIFLHWVDGLSWMNLQMSYANMLLPLACVLGLGVHLLLPIRALRPAAMTLILTAVYPTHPHIPDEEFKVQILDVGQGLAVLIQTHAHAVLYDTGGQIYHGSDMGKLVILPYFQHIGLRSLDKIIISHPDLDHRGGLLSIQASFPQAELIVDDPKFYTRGSACHDYPDWSWEGVHFHFFPLKMDLGSTNNRSCILQVSNSSGKVLLTGDIEKVAERVLMKLYGSKLHSTVLIVPHHGSNTSSSRKFLQTVAPSYAILSYGFDNRYHFPHTPTMKRYRDFHIPTAATAEQGLISLWFQKSQWKILKE